MTPRVFARWLARNDPRLAEHRHLTARGIFPLSDLKIDYLVYSLKLATHIIIKNNLYKGKRSILKIYELLYEDIYRVAKFINS